MLRCIVVLFLIVSTAGSNSDNTNCYKILFKYGINRDIRSAFGWRKVIKNGKLYLYTNKKYYIDPVDLNDIYKCLIIEYKNQREL